MEQKAKNVSPFSNESRNAYVVEHLTGSMLTLLKEKPISEISISELCEVAGVGRTSFYRNFETREDILKTYMERKLRDWSLRWEGQPEPPLGELIYRVFCFFENDRDFYSLLNERGLVYLLKDIILDICNFDPEQEAVAAYASAYAAFSLYGWIETWFRRGMRESAKELAALFGNPSHSRAD